MICRSCKLTALTHQQGLTPGYIQRDPVHRFRNKDAIQRHVTQAHVAIYIKLVGEEKKEKDVHNESTKIKDGKMEKLLFFTRLPATIDGN